MNIGPEESDDRQLQELTERQQWDQWLSEDKDYLLWLQGFETEEQDEH